MASTYWSPDEPAGPLDDIEHLRDHFDPLSRDLTRGRYTRVAGTMARECPVAHTDQFGDGLWTVSGYEQLVAVHREEGETYSNFPVLLQSFGQVRPMIPMESDPPLHRQYKQIICECRCGAPAGRTTRLGAGDFGVTLRSCGRSGMPSRGDVSVEVAGAGLAHQLA